MDDASWRAIAARQAGVMHVHQLVDSGVSPARIQRLAASGVLRRVSRGVYALVGVPPSFIQRSWAAQLWSVEGTICGRTAARILDLDVPAVDDVEVHVPCRRRAPAGVVLWRGAIPKEDQSRVRGLRVTTMPRTVIDCARHLSEEEMDVLLDSAIRRGMRRRTFMSRMAEICVPGRPGGRLVRKLVSERETEQGLTGSAFERLILRTIKWAGLPMPVCQWPCADKGFKAYIDFAYPEMGIAIEADGYRWHDGRQAFESDRRRMSELASRGWRVISVTWTQLKYDSVGVTTRLERALRTPPLVQLRG